MTSEFSLSIDELGSFVETLRGDLKISSSLLADKVQSGAPKDITVAQLLLLAAETAGSMVSRHPDWSFLAARLLIKGIELETPSKFSEYVELQQDELTSEFVKFVTDHKAVIDNAIDFSQDQNTGYFAVRTLQRTYLHKGERLQYMWMRVALAIHMPDLQAGLESYRLMSQKYFTHATPTLLNAGYRQGQLASCFLLAMKDSSVEGVFETLKECAMIIHKVGGIGLHCSNIPSARSNSSEQYASGIIPMLRVFNNASRFIGQGGNKRPGAISVTLEPWHADIFDFLDAKKNHGKEEYRARDLFYALWVPDLFMEKIKNDEDWYLFSPDTAPGLQDVYGEDFNKLYNEYVKAQKYVSVLPARKLWSAILDAQIETGNPSLLYKDSCNAKSNQQNLGTIKSSNLCTEIIEYSSEDETAVCNLASVGLPMFVSNGGSYDFAKLHEVTKVLTKNLNRTIDINYYPLENCRVGNLRHRPLALGVQGLADVYFKMKLDFDSQQAQELNRKIFETIYHAAVETSIELAEEHGHPYQSFEGSPTASGKLQFDLWGKPPKDDLWNWTALRERLRKHGLYNSLLTAVMPTASTSQILGFTESVEPLTSNIYTRRTLSGEFQITNEYMVKDLDALGLWDEATREEIIASNGSLQHIEKIPLEIRKRYRSAWELSMKSIIDQSVDRGPYIDQSQSLNLFLSQPTHRQLTSMHFNAWSRGLKTGVYYLRTQPAAAPIPFTVSHETRKRVADASAEASVSPEGTPSTKRSCSPLDLVCEACT